MKNSRWIGGVILMLAAAGIFFLFNATDYSIPATITLLIIGISLMATARRTQA